MYELLPLQHLAPGQAGKVDQLMGRPDLVQRLEELGLRRGSRVEMVCPGSPCIVRLRDCKLCVRQDDLGAVLVRAGEEP